MESDPSYDRDEETHNDSPTEMHAPRRPRKSGKYNRVELTSLEQEINANQESWPERANIHLERLLEKANKEKTLLRHMAYHYIARNKVCKARIRSLTEKLKKASKRQKKHEGL